MEGHHRQPQPTSAGSKYLSEYLEHVSINSQNINAIKQDLPDLEELDLSCNEININDAFRVCERFGNLRCLRLNNVNIQEAKIITRSENLVIMPYL